MVSVLSGCSSKVMTVADDVYSSDNKEEGYTEIAGFKVKDSNKNNKEKIGYCALLIPSDFVESKDIKGMYVNSLYPLDASNIYYSIEDASGLGFVEDELKEQNYEAMVEKGFAADKIEADLIIDSFEKNAVNGVDCYKIRSHYSLGDNDIQQLTYIIAAHETHVITYTQMDDDKLLADFVNDDGRIRLVREISQS